MIRVVLPHHLRTLARVGDEVQLDLNGSATIRSLLDALEQKYPMLQGTIRDHGTRRERPTSLDDHGGRGVQLMRELADVEVAVDQRGTEVTIRRELSGIKPKP